MAKSVYSMVLSDEVISLVDNAALKKGVSRSQLINDILAEYVGYSTKKQRIEEILNIVSKMTLSHERIRVLRRQQSTIDFLSAIDYKYNPRVTYSVALFTDDEDTGYLKISLRTTNAILLQIINDFFQSFIAIESKYIDGVEYSVVDGKLLRKLNLKNMMSSDEIALKLTEYVNNIDKLINIYTQDYFRGNADINLENNYLKILSCVNF